MTRRDNGLHATAYVRVADVETHVVDGLLDRLRDEEVAAYVAPAGGHRGPYGDTVLPGTPSDSVYVDSQREQLARGVVDRYMREIREELTWAGIVAGYDQPSSDTVPRWPASEDVEAASTGDDHAGPGRVIRPARSRDDLPAAAGDVDEAPVPGASPEDPDDHFLPPPPPPLPMPDVLGRFAWAAVLGGPLFLLVGTIFGLDISGWPGLLAVAAFVGGFVTLVARMKDRPPTDSGYDDGAVV